VNPDSPIASLQAHLAWAPPWTFSVAVAAVALAAAQLVYNTAVRAVQRPLARRNPFWSSLVVRTRGPGRLALILAALSWSVHAAPFPSRQATAIQHGLGILFIVLVGWAVLAAVDIGAALYLRRYRVDVADNLLARKHVTQVRILKRAVNTLVILLTAGMALMTIPGVRQLGVSVLAAGGAAGIIVGLALQPVLSNLMAGLQIALTQPIRIDDAVNIQNEFGTVEEINATYVVVRLWDQRRLITPLKYFIEQPFQNWSHQSSQLLGTIMFYVDYRVPIEPLRKRFEEIVRASKLWDRRVMAFQVTDARERTVELRGLISARNAGEAFDLRCEVREKMIAFLRNEFPDLLPRNGVELSPNQLALIKSMTQGDSDERIQ
jgi:small-conductance mechanosensitive channel